MSAGATGAFDVHKEVIARSRADVDLEEIERDLIAPAPVVEDEKAALWLLAWCDMPQIIVTSNPAERGRESKVMLRERVGAADFESAHFKAQLLERSGGRSGTRMPPSVSQPPSTTRPRLRTSQIRPRVGWHMAGCIRGPDGRTRTMTRPAGRCRLRQRQPGSLRVTWTRV